MGPAPAILADVRKEEDGSCVLSVVAEDAQAVAAGLQDGSLSIQDFGTEDPRVDFLMQMILCQSPPPPIRVQFRLEKEAEPVVEAQSTGKLASLGPNTDDYFESYGDLTVHELMLKDAPRMSAYRDAIEKNKHLFEGRTVLDVGSGSGVLAMWCARAGARTVYAVEASGMARMARTLVAHNGLDQVVRVIEEAVENVELPEKVDIIVSEWMGFHLLHESMLNSVVRARDRWLRPGGTVFPGRCDIVACPVTMERLRGKRREELAFWSDVGGGLDFSPLGDELAAQDHGAPLVECIEPAQLLAAPRALISFDCASVSEAELNTVTGEAPFCAARAGDAAGVAVWFECHFDGGTDGSQVVLSTAPDQAPTHWKQSIVLLGGFVPVQPGDDMSLRLTLQQDERNPRHYRVSVVT
jgi:protein arginine N-methyltransferase 6